MNPFKKMITMMATMDQRCNNLNRNLSLSLIFGSLKNKVPHIIAWASF